MKTTIDLPDHLVEQVKTLAREQGVTMRELMVDGLRREVERRRAKPVTVDFTFTVVDGEGLNPDVEPMMLSRLAYDLPT